MTWVMAVAVAVGVLGALLSPPRGGVRFVERIATVVGWGVRWTGAGALVSGAAWLAAKPGAWFAREALTEGIPPDHRLVPAAMALVAFVAAYIAYRGAWIVSGERLPKISALIVGTIFALAAFFHTLRAMLALLAAFVAFAFAARGAAKYLLGVAEGAWRQSAETTEYGWWIVTGRLTGGPFEEALNFFVLPWLDAR